MSVEFIGYISNNNSSETIVRSGPVLDRHHIETVAKAHENAGFDRALLAFHSTTPDGLQIGQHVLGVTDRLNVLIAQRPGFTAPTLIARQLATIDQLSGGRVALHVITGGNATELKQDGNTIDDKDERYARTDEFLDVVRTEWTSEKPFSYDGKYYKVQNGFSQVKPYRSEGIPIFVGGASDAAIEVAGKHADTFALWGESYAQVRDVTSRVRAAAARHGRPTPRFSLSVRPILADTEEKAWVKAEEILAQATLCKTRPATANRLMVMRPPAPDGCSRWRSKVPVSINVSGRKSQNSRVPTATPPRWSERPRRSPKFLATIAISVSVISSFAASIRSSTPSNMAVN
jgi:alkanesulfonate monooxygenase